MIRRNNTSSLSSTRSVYRPSDLMARTKPPVLGKMLPKRTSIEFLKLLACISCMSCNLICNPYIAEVERNTTPTDLGTQPSLIGTIPASFLAHPAQKRTHSNKKYQNRVKNHRCTHTVAAPTKILKFLKQKRQQSSDRDTSLARLVHCTYRGRNPMLSVLEKREK